LNAKNREENTQRNVGKCEAKQRSREANQCGQLFSKADGAP